MFQWSLAQWEYFGLWPQWENYDNGEYFDDCNDDGDDDYVDDDRDDGFGLLWPQCENPSSWRWERNNGMSSVFPLIIFTKRFPHSFS